MFGVKQVLKLSNYGYGKRGNVMICKNDKMLMDEYPDKWECMNCGYTIMKLNDEMSQSQINKIVSKLKRS